MAGDWIKMRKDLLTSPKVVRIASALKADRLHVVGGLFAVWCLFDTHSVDGRLDGYTAQALDDLAGFPGLSAAMASCGWLAETAQGIEMPRFDEHNGKSAKRRVQDADRKRDDRKTSALDADKKRTREEKIREDIAAATSGGKKHQATVVPIKTDPQPDEISDLATLGEANFARLVAEHHASAFGLSRAVPVGMQLGSLVTLRAQSYAPAQSGDWWLNYFEHCAADGFLNGTKNPQFKADLIYLLDEKTFGRVIEASQKEAAHG